MKPGETTGYSFRVFLLKNKGAHVVRCGTLRVAINDLAGYIRLPGAEVSLGFNDDNAIVFRVKADHLHLAGIKRLNDRGK